MLQRVLITVCLICALPLFRYQYLEIFRHKRFHDYLRKFNKSYSGEEYGRRLLYFEKSLKDIEKLNSKEHGTGAVHGLTKFSDWSDEELAAIMIRAYGPSGYYKPSDCTAMIERCSGHYSTKSNLTQAYKDVIPKKFDWRDKGVIGPVPDQKLCNGCWAFGIIGVMESMAVIQGYGHPQLSVQQLLDCSPDTGKCSGGNIGTALYWLCWGDIRITTAERYPLLLINQDCKMTPTAGMSILNYTIACQMSMDEILSHVVNGPVLAVVLARPWRNYVSGIIERNCVDDADVPMVHVVQIVGYDTTAPVPYYIIKNSYGTDFGEEGYVRVALRGNVCGVRNYIGFLYVRKE